MPSLDRPDKREQEEREKVLLGMRLKKLEVEFQVLQEKRANIIQQQKNLEELEEQQPQDILRLEQSRRDTLRLQKGIEVKFREIFYCKKRLDKLSGNNEEGLR